MNNFKKNLSLFLLIFFLVSCYTQVFANEYSLTDDIEVFIKRTMKKGKIPGLSLIIVDGDNTAIKNFGYSDVEERIKVTQGTKFELASCSKAFTALAIAKLENDGLINLSDTVDKYLPWFYVEFEGNRQKITIEQVLHHTSGIPVTTISNFTQSTSDNALENAVRSLVGMQLKNEPGEVFEYATINYDILGAIIEERTNMSYEKYMTSNILKPLGLNNTTVGINKQDESKAKGYKISFFKPREYHSPIFRGNYPAGYVVSSGKDIARWLKLQMGIEENEYSALIEKTHIPDRSVLPNRGDFSSYAMGWTLHQNDREEINHGGLNPNFTSYIAFSKKNNVGVAVLANSNSGYTQVIGNYIMGYLNGEKDMVLEEPNDIMDRACSVVSIILSGIIIAVLGFLGLFISEIIRKKREYKGLNSKKLKKWIMVVLTSIPYIFAIYIIPKGVAKSNWETIIVWTPKSFISAIALLGILMGLVYVLYGLLLLFPHENKYKRDLPSLIALSLISGVANAMVIFLITNSVNSDIEIGYLLFYFVLILFIYIYGRKVVETRLVEMTQSIIYDLRINIFKKLFATSYQNFEKLDSGQVLATINNDTARIGQAANLLVAFITSVVTVVCVFIYLGTISLVATLMSLLVIFAIAVLYYIVVRKATRFMEEARDTQNVFMSKIEGLIKGFKELSMHFKKKVEYKKEVEKVSGEFRDKSVLGAKNFINSFLIGESLFIVVLGTISFGFPIIFPSIRPAVLVSFIIVLLYILGPINAILRVVPQIVEINIARKRIEKLIKEIPARQKNRSDRELFNRVDNIKAENVVFKYEEGTENKRFEVGPINLEVEAGEILFLIGGNGSGKTTLAKLITGLYAPMEGSIKINGKELKGGDIGEYISVIFSDFHLFERLYDVDCNNKEKEIEEYLKLLGLEEKVEIRDGCFSTTDLSTGQKKRLALLRCYLEDRPIYLFDELAADQDPQFRKIFYRSLLPKMKEKGKIVIAITHDDHYFDVADKILKMDMGQIEIVDTNNLKEIAIS